MNRLGGDRGAGHGESPLHLLAARRGVEVAYTDAFDKERRVGDETVVKVLACLGEPIRRPADAIAILDGERSKEREGEGELPAVVVAWGGRLPPVHVASAEARAGIGVELALEDGGDAAGLVKLEVLGNSTAVVAAGPLPFGVHEIAVARTGTRRSGLAQRAGGVPFESGLAQRAGGHDPAPAREPEPEPEAITVISAPARVEALPSGSWGVFSPLYGLSCEEGRADLSCLERLGTHVARLGARFVATLPLLADFSRRDEPDAATSPYSPLSRLWWNEGYLDASRVPELAGLFGPAALDTSSALAGHTDVARRAGALRLAFEEAARLIERRGGSRLEAYRAFVGRRPDVVTYARYRAACGRAGTDPSRWPGAWRHGLVDDDSVDQGAVAAHVFAQFAVDEQLEALSTSLAASGVGIVLDLPVGCKPAGYDPWAYPESFASGASVGAPPDRFFSEGQDWGFRPLHPGGERESGYEVTAAVLRHLLRHAAGVRLDHVMGLARLWWIPEGMSPTEGTYVRYHVEETLALCCLEAWRTGAFLIGEDLGTVEPSLREALAEHGVAGMHVAVFDLEAESIHPMEPLAPRAGSTALVDTHDTATFAGWFSGYDIEQRSSLGLSSPDTTAAPRSRRAIARDILVDRLIASDLLAEDEAGDPVSVHEGLLGELGASPAALVLVNLEDCWGEVDPQNIPGTAKEHPNFSRALSRSLPEIERDERVTSALVRLETARRTVRSSPGGAGEDAVLGATSSPGSQARPQAGR